jgi:hypothetical protein
MRVGQVRPAQVSAGSDAASAPRLKAGGAAGDDSEVTGRKASNDPE